MDGASSWRICESDGQTINLTGEGIKQQQNFFQVFRRAVNNSENDEFR
jgi:hypothetical protein